MYWSRDFESLLRVFPLTKISQYGAYPALRLGPRFSDGRCTFVCHLSYLRATRGAVLGREPPQSRAGAALMFIPLCQEI
ncbi:hypothetical protein NDU88_004343 [Pleurodeles waltl]|uniref:Uncharacterized protein n=1 Tax=Pleurodeles waltl TaxID=8319 RepID=A0AAV7RL19_PLEWA|nr:hypothetical protein NDU88_004343 [Pleurodeles waltl]